MIYAKKGYLNYEEQIGYHKYTSVYFMEQKFLDANLNLINPPNSTMHCSNIEFDYIHKYNNMGFRDKDIDTTSDVFRVIMLGDSFTEGNGASSDSCMPELLECKYKQANSTAIDVYNCGVAGSDPVFQYRFYTTMLKDVKHNVLVLNTNISDIFEIAARGGSDRFSNNIYNANHGPKWEYCFAVSRLFRIIVSKFLKYDPMILTSSKNSVLRYNKAYNQYKDALFDIYKNTKSKQIKFIVVYNPHLFDFNINSYKLVTDKRFENKIKYDYSNGNFPFEIIFLKDSLIKYNLIDTNNVTNYYWMHDYHFNSKGYDKWATYLYKSKILQ